MSAIRFQNFSFRYSGAKQPTLKNITLTVEKGEKVLIAGPSGSGKSTLAHCINGLILASAGEYTGFYQLLEQSPAGQDLPAISEQVGTVLQDQDAQFVGLSVGEDVAFADENRNVPLPQMQANVQRALTAVAMLDQIAMPPAQLSGGQKQRVSLAGLLTTPGEILLLDEPLANLDPQSSRTALELIAQINQTKHKTVIVIEHRIEEVLASGVNRLIIMNNGEIVAAGSPDQLLTTDLLIRNGLREPLYIEFLKTAGIRFSDAESLTQLGGAGQVQNGR